MRGPRSRALVLAATLLIQGAGSIRITSVKVPPLVKVGSEAELKCEWEEEKDQMYSVKWYQGNHEFYRYTPTASRRTQIFDPNTLDVVRTGSEGGTVRVANITTAAEGPFHCEVSAEGPTFHTASDTANMRVVEPPKGGPEVTGARQQYQVGDKVELTCTSRKSRPAATLSFTINARQVSRNWL
ncbi:junctional adhesion molecule 2A-like isoform X3 [Eriocheir sinensis]|uniref:junctional adhesion molecule 2A-like isoform X3 n=1 Tax=Eriocheir sinensis TaxID=95602 RepID=UPI0021CAE035|nr:junctional adhesion molecule 2A-like isoform X3 [Eriocheir sinensis]